MTWGQRPLENTPGVVCDEDTCLGKHQDLVSTRRLSALHVPAVPLHSVGVHLAGAAATVPSLSSLLCSVRSCLPARVLPFPHTGREEPRGQWSFGRGDSQTTTQVLRRHQGC